jgi:DNA mismatch repair protein MutH
MVTRVIAIRNLEKFIGQDLSELAKQYGITTFKDGKQNKGWKGLTLEYLAGLSNEISKHQTGLGLS